MSILLSSWKTRLVSFLKAEKTAKLQYLVILPVYASPFDGCFCCCVYDPLGHSGTGRLFSKRASVECTQHCVGRVHEVHIIS